MLLDEKATPFMALPLTRSFGENPFMGSECVLKKCCKKYKKGKRCKKCPDR